MRSLLRKVGLFYAVLCGIAVTWTAGAFGLALLAPRGCARPLPHGTRARYLAAEAASAVQISRITERRCPTRDQLVGRHYVDARSLVDPWGTSMTIRCTPGGSVVVRSAGPDLLFDTNDDITSD